MLKVVVVSDTHMPRMAKKLPDPLIEALKTADVILHAGDWTDVSIVTMLRKYAPVHGICGNNDGHELVRMLGLRRIVTLEGVRIGIVHGHGQGKREDTETRAFRAFEPGEVDVIVFGHSHIPLHKQRDGILLFNPGSPTDRRRSTHYAFGIFKIHEGSLTAEHVKYLNK